MSYIVIPKSISKYSQGKNKNTDIYVYSYIKLNSNFKTGISQITEETISLKLDIPLRTVERIISRLKADNNKIIMIETLQKEKTKRRNLYSFEKKPVPSNILCKRQTTGFKSFILESCFQI